MSVYTELNQADVASILSDYAIGDLQSFAGIAAGIENSNFFVNTEQGRFVLTIFERMEEQELPYFMRLMKHLSHHGLSCPDVMVRNDGSLLFDVCGKKGCIVSCLCGRTLDELNMAQLRSSGHALATLHLAGENFDEKRSNPTGIRWLSETILCMQSDMAKQYGDDAAWLLHDELVFQQAQDVDLPRGVIHGDLFVDNILFEGDEVTGIIDFYYAHDAPYAMDIAISLNAQAILLGPDDTARMQAFLDGYQSSRPLADAEKAALPGLLRLGALRFWTSRLYDALYPRGGAMTQTKDPEEYRLKLLFHRR
ncbi:MAG: homoserine kinase [Zetaproteobacteria bacterium CG06_land_8_20_14_3_00_59_53]|nr:MAG: homoserine kinase [Zetaproteobacteria bacterium CG2_30_59_37]PIO90896.1 MAG: homoserine kinase [Zetaproteobacteria bacterium CG23_combo_of_CG06-09_8_20_14_all_59_86]PIQ64134.1 MAG: homoserine kinase [Zetaproteobacteria bacterium CG11_big_fil_rev_8_21_14_0_20_59_439]PIU71077.1 MAG: homoserine kinase [Zetaproteobacteria bacterium CG06_land_8_20_14_3_00_59_53]PIU96071.1 MAG: homoserine kinase [Zetaproteobacteria bacterium CG03_land_8_20_14_0_80_59_51]PIY46381.1 MAG: homoserine kinase [Zet